LFSPVTKPTVKPSTPVNLTPYAFELSTAVALDGKCEASKVKPSMIDTLYLNMLSPAAPLVGPTPPAVPNHGSSFAAGIMSSHLETIELPEMW
jgi:hypothetical protein